jgi:hypothetical protein
LGELTLVQQKQSIDVCNRTVVGDVLQATGRQVSGGDRRTGALRNTAQDARCKEKERERE